MVITMAHARVDAFLVFVAILSALNPAAATDRHSRGPTIKSLRPSLDKFPDHVHFSKEGPLGISEIADSVWGGAKPGLAVGLAGFAQGPQLQLPEYPKGWSEMQTEQDSRFQQFRSYLQNGY